MIMIIVLMIMIMTHNQYYDYTDDAINDNTQMKVLVLDINSSNSIHNL